MKTVDIKGKAYVMINERIKFFRESDEYKGWSLFSEIVSHSDGRILIKAVIIDTNGAVIATGLAQEKEGDGFINKTSYVENCETSAWGRALGNLGIGVDASIASAEEVQNAIKNQSAPSKQDLSPRHSRWLGAIDSLRNQETTINEIKQHFNLTDQNEAILINESQDDPIREGKNYNQTDIKQKIK